MKIPCAAILLFAATESVVVDAFVPQKLARTPFASSSSSLEAKNTNGDDKSFWGFATTASTFLAWTLASQIAVATPNFDEVTPNEFIQAPETSSVVVSGLIGSNVETMDFSLPSYDAVTKGDVSGPGKSIPSFNPFGDFAEEKTEAPAAPVVDSSASKAEEKAAAEAKKAEEKAAAEAKKAEEKAAAEAKKAEEKAAEEQKKAEAEAKKAEKAARLEEQRQKQKEAAEKAKEAEAKAAAAATKEAAAAPAAEAPSIPTFDIPEMKVPEMKVPEMKVPEMKVPDMPEMKMPDMPEMKMPDMPKMSFSMPKVEAPKFDAPKFDVPEFTAPKVDTPKVSLPKIPEFSAPKSDYDFSVKAPPAAVDINAEPLEPQEVRDQRAREARSVFTAADNEAKEMEAKARELRNIANEKKKIAKEAKDLACETRPGGKLICIRPFNSGY